MAYLTQLIEKFLKWRYPERFFLSDEQKAHILSALDSTELIATAISRFLADGKSLEEAKKALIAFAAKNPAAVDPIVDVLWSLRTRLHAGFYRKVEPSGPDGPRVLPLTRVSQFSDQKQVFHNRERQS